jgi:uncharacterized protein (DUF1778 family)
MKTNDIETKKERLQLRLTNQQKDIINRASQIKQTTMTNFILEQSYQAALNVLAEQTLFSLSDQGWNEFCQALEAPPKDIPSLRKLLTEPGIFDEYKA